MKKYPPAKFRDLEIGGTVWQEMIRICPEIREEMETWASGPVFVIGRPLHKKEIKLLNVGWEYRCEPLRVTALDLFAQLAYIHELEASFVYLKGFPDYVQRSIDAILRFTGSNTRVKFPLTDSAGHAYPTGTAVDKTA